MWVGSGILAMNRRQFLAAVGVASLAGCQSQASEQTPTETASPTPTATETPTATPTPEPAHPVMSNVTVLSDWKEYGDVLDNQRDQIAPDDPAIVGARFRLVCASDREIRWRTTVQIRDESDEVVSNYIDDYDDFTSDCAEATTTRWEQPTWMHYDNDQSAEWPEGEYEATVRIDDYHGEAEVYGTATFTVEAE